MAETLYMPNVPYRIVAEGMRGQTGHANRLAQSLIEWVQ